MPEMEEDGEEEKSLRSAETNADFEGRNPSSEVAGTSCTAVELVGMPATGFDGKIEFSRGNDVCFACRFVSTINVELRTSKNNAIYINYSISR